MKRLIDTQDAFNVLTDYYHHNSATQHLALQEALNKVPTADTEPHWISCSERLPEKEDWFLVTTCRGVEIGKYLLPLEGTKPLIGHWIDDGFFGINPYAWMPLPRHYEVEE